MQRFWHRGKLAMIDELLRPHLKADSRVLEVGCGAGNLLVQASAPGSYPIGLDLSLQALTFVRARLRELESDSEPIRGFACVQSVGETLPFADHTVDSAILSEVIEHLEAPQASIREATRVLRPGGRLLVTTPNYRSLWPLIEWTVDRLNMAPKMGGEQHISRFDPVSLMDLMRECGLHAEYFGTIYSLSPFASMLSPRLAMKQLAGELKRRSSLGMILVAVGVKA